ncbi:hypothetical protein BKA64DRAFT_704382 [Cadophora sp. MPI-SDFR-AT-0126]|nr:hypothetical protein BKA64DRAFT_704382 [Leotiomycetes sp. MPI-SDFR-AT-0126]
MGSILSRPTSDGKLENAGVRPQIRSLDWSPFRLLPNELVLYISSFLPREAMAALALTCHPLRLALPESFFKVPWEDKINFLELLERELPGHVVCRYCRKLHAIERAEMYLLTRIMRAPYSACRWEQMWSDIDRYFHKEFSIVVFEMAMKQYRLGLNTSRLLRLLSSEARTYQKVGYVEQHNALARVVDSRLLMRDQRTCFMPADHQESLPQNAKFVICPHFTLSTSSLETLKRLPDKFDRSDPPETQACPSGTDLIPCRYCHTEFRVSFRSFGDSGTGVSIMTWKDLGGSLLDDKWRSHIGSEVDMIPFDRGSLCTAFEDEDYRSFKLDWSLASEVQGRQLKGKGSARKMFR